MIIDPVTVRPDELTPRRSTSCAAQDQRVDPVTKDGKLVGILTNRDLRFEKRLNRKVAEVMTKDNLVDRPPRHQPQGRDELRPSTASRSCSSSTSAIACAG